MNPVEKNYLKELLEYIGLDLRMDDKESEYSIICDAEGIAYARVRDGGYHINDSVPLEKEYQIQDAIQRAYGFRVQFERSESLDSLGVNGYRKIGGFGDAVLAAKLMQDNRMEYVVWNYDANRKGLNQGAYCSQLETAKMKLLEREHILPFGYKLLNVTEFTRYEQMKESEEVLKPKDRCCQSKRRNAIDPGLPVILCGCSDCRHQLVDQIFCDFSHPAIHHWKTDCHHHCLHEPHDKSYRF
jgi:hypothetical protein